MPNLSNVQRRLGYREVYYNTKTDEFVTPSPGDNYETLAINVSGGGGPDPEPDPDPTPIVTTAISISPSTLSGTAGSSQQLLVTYTPSFATDTKVSFNSSNPSAASVDGNGLVTYNAPGAATITATLDSNTQIKSTAYATVSSEVIEATGINLTGPSTLMQGNTGNTSVTFTPVDATTRDVTYASDDVSVEVSNIGVLTAKSVGTANVTATGYNGINDSIEVSVLSSGVPVTSLFVDTIQGVLSTMSVGEDYKLIYGISPQNATNKSATLQILDENGTDITATGMTQQPSVLNGEAGGAVDFQLLDGAIGQNRIINVISVDNPSLVAPYSYPVEVFGAGLAPQEDNYLPFEVPTAGQTFDVHIMIGQSNMMGRGDYKKVTTAPPQGSCYTWNFGEDGLRPTTNSFTHNADSSNAGFITGYAKSLYNNSSVDRKVIICPAARGNTSLPEWLPGTDLYNGIVSTYTSLKAYMQTNSLTIGKVCIDMHQGESDMHGNGAKGNGIIYLNNLHQIRWALQEDFPDLDEFIIHRVGIDAPPNYNNSKYFRIMQAQHAAAYLSPDLFKLGYLACASFYGTSDQNDVHYTQEGYNRWGAEAGGYVVDGLENDNWLDPNDITQDPSYQYVAGADIDVFITSSNNTIISRNLENPENYIVPSQGSLGQLTGAIPLTTPITADFSKDQSFFLSVAGYDTNAGNSIKLLNDNSDALNGAFNWIDTGIKTFVDGTGGDKWQIPLDSSGSPNPLAFSSEIKASGEQAIYLADIDSNIADISDLATDTESINDSVTFTHLFDPAYYPASKTVRQVVSYGWCSSGMINKQYATILNANLTGSGSAGNSESFWYHFDNDIQNYGDCEMLSGLENPQYTAQGSLLRSSIVGATNGTLRLADDDNDYMLGVKFEIMSPFSTDDNNGQTAYSIIVETSGLGADPYGNFWLSKGEYNTFPRAFTYRNQGSADGVNSFKTHVNMETLMDDVGSMVEVVWKWFAADRKMEMYVNGTRESVGYLNSKATLNLQFLKNTFFVRDFANAAVAYKAQRFTKGHPSLIANFFDVPSTKKAPYDTSIDLAEYIRRTTRDAMT